MSNVISKWENREKRIENGERKNKNNRQRMPIIRKKVVTLQSEIKQNEYESNNH